ncbi:MAG: zinc ribbon domain-containing protein [Chloroflexi bacterium]|nr:zinc ribbon domain-containing protein [Chloroflexota bacterium]
MPLYDYRCDHCQTVFEVRASFKEKEAGLKPKCPQCYSHETQQLLTSGLFLRSGDNDMPLGSSGCGPNAGLGCCG